jgi:hypothetical protein
MIIRIIGNVVGFVLVIAGIPLFISPIPLGALLVFFGLIILIAFNPWVAKLVKSWRRRSERVNAFFHKAEEILPDDLAGPLQETENRPEDDGNSPSESAPPMQRVTIPRLLR